MIWMLFLFRFSQKSLTLFSFTSFYFLFVVSFVCPPANIVLLCSLNLSITCVYLQLRQVFNYLCFSLGVVWQVFWTSQSCIKLIASSVKEIQVVQPGSHHQISLHPLYLRDFRYKSVVITLLPAPARITFP